MKTDVVVIGAGPSGMMAAITAAEQGKRVVLLEKNSRAGKKLLLTGNGRCNVCNAVENSEVIKAFYKKGKFLYKALHHFSSTNLMNWLQKNGLSLIQEANNRVFPKSQHSIDVLNVFLDNLNKNKVAIIYSCEVKNIITNSNKVIGVLTNKETINCSAVIVATGGKSYVNTGSDGAGYKFAEQTGHKIINIKPGLTGLNSLSSNIHVLKGLSLSNVLVKVYVKNKLVASEQGDFIFTHYGVSGPAIINLSRFVAINEKKEVHLLIDLLPTTTNEDLCAKLNKMLSNNNKKLLKNILTSLVSERFMYYLLSSCEIDGNKQASHVKKKEINQIIHKLKQFKIAIKSCRGFDEAMITVGGVHLKQINPSTMQSNLCKGLYFVGEVLDLDGKTGGFNLQAAFATGYVAGLNA
ncbi:NAD(P)/FAD-dependent oxidoreductase [Clostridium sp. 'deep sea']|uniref:NAD(P)/FAD-dependent oxidoreductase n=1 Tax=Clostridium sp. 'deep sea' TaxID=2779445 RepID=UPI00189641AD|nr:NAD(P)/FAD-dependent oxidoreductase [Clostridium sp. 'deep sea']QOR35941.1 NAD(P)/FAD-dependent oxidoreductase [Clostridium sp. 'deep sea']